MSVSALANAILEAHPSIVYFDMDGVLCDFAGHATALIRALPYRRGIVDPYGHRVTKDLQLPEDEFWRRIDEAGQNFWEYCPELEEGVALWRELVGKVPLCILTSPSKHPSSAAGKMAWLARVLGGGSHFRDFIITSQKWMLGQPRRVLIDDRAKHVNQFRNQGGRAILWEGLNSSTEDLKGLL